LTFQLPSLLTEQVTFVIMPLLSLIEDNHSFVTNLGIPSLQLSSGNGAAQKKSVYYDIKNKKYKIVYLTPEKLLKSERFLSVLEEMYEEKTIARFVIDEVHCVSHWG